MEKENQKIYELAYFIAPLEKEEAVFIAAEKIKNLMTGHKAEIQKEEPAKRRQLAYPIKHKNTDTSVFFNSTPNQKAYKE